GKAALRRSGPAGLVRHERPARPRPRPPCDPEPPRLGRSLADGEGDAVNGAERGAGRVVPRNVHDAPALRFDRGQPAPIALPCEARPVVFEAVALARDESIRPGEIDTESAHGVLTLGRRELAPAQETGDL